jgi:hypothetical protein
LAQRPPAVQPLMLARDCAEQRKQMQHINGYRMKEERAKFVGAHPADHRHPSGQRRLAPHARGRAERRRQEVQRIQLARRQELLKRLESIPAVVEPSPAAAASPTEPQLVPEQVASPARPGKRRGALPTMEIPAKQAKTEEVEMTPGRFQELSATCEPFQLEGVAFGAVGTFITIEVDGEWYEGLIVDFE